MAYSKAAILTNNSGGPFSVNRRQAGIWKSDLSVTCLLISAPLTANKVVDLIELHFPNL